MARGSDTYDYLLRIVVVGEAEAGKSSLVTRFCESEFSVVYVPTIGVDFSIRTLSVGGRVVKLQIYDTAGQERFESVVRSFYRNASAIILVVDVTNGNGLDSVPGQLAKIRSIAPKDAHVVLFANKCDSGDRKLGQAEIAKLAQENDISNFECSAKTAENVNEAFIKVAELAESSTEDSDSHPVGISRPVINKEKKRRKKKKTDRQDKNNCSPTCIVL